MQKLVEIIKSKAPSLSESDVFRALCSDVFQLLGADVISIWSIDDESQVTRRYLFENGEEVPQSRNELATLPRDQHQDYFSEILTSIYVLAPDVTEHPHLASLLDVYFKPGGIHSLLDYVIYRDMRPIGIICCESRTHRDWDIEDVEKIRSLTVAMSFEFEAQIFPIE